MLAHLRFLLLVNQQAMLGYFDGGVEMKVNVVGAADQAHLKRAVGKLHSHMMMTCCLLAMAADDLL